MGGESEKDGRTDHAADPFFRTGLHIKFFRADGNDDFFSVLHAADLTVLPSHFETFGLVLAEGMAMGKPAIAFSVGGTPEIVKDGETGFLVEKDNEKELYERIKQLDSDRSLLKQFSENGSRWIRSQFTNHRMVDDLEVIYHELSP